MTHFRLDVTKTSITSGFWPDVTLDVSLPVDPGGHPLATVPGGHPTAILLIFASL